MHARGYAFLGNDYYDGQSLANMVDQSLSTVDQDDHIGTLKDLVPRLNGAWGLVVDWGGKHVLAAVDRCRSIPLFYARTSYGYIIASSTNNIATQLGDIEIDNISAAEFLLSGYVSGRATLYKGVYQIQPSELVEFDVSNAEPRHVGYDHFHGFSEDIAIASQTELEEELEQIFETTFARFAATLRGKRVILPLSGGYDSRLIAWMLKKYGVHDVLCYTYGVATNPQRTIAEQVAKALGFEWRFIEYDAQRWADCMSSSEMAGYLDYSFRGTSSPHLQDFPAVMELAKEFNTNSPPIFLPGHVGDAWACEFAVRQLDEKYPHPPSEYHSEYVNILDCPVVSAIVYRHLNLWPVRPKLWNLEPLASVVNKIYDNVIGYENSRGFDVWAYVEWVLRSRTAIWIVNSCRCFEYFGGDFLLTLGSYEIIDFFRKLPDKFLLNRGLYASTLRQRIFGKNNRLLYGIPVMSGVVGSFRTNKTNKDMILQMLLKMCLFKPLDRLRRPFRSPRNLYFESWFTNGRRPEKVSIKDTLTFYGVEEYLPNELIQIVKPLLRRPVYSIQCNGLLTAVMLAREFSKKRQYKGI